MVHQNVEIIRKFKGVTKTHLAKKLDLSLQGYRHIMSGNTKLDVERLKIIAEELGVNVAIFFDDELTNCVIKKNGEQQAATLEWAG